VLAGSLWSELPVYLRRCYPPAIGMSRYSIPARVFFAIFGFVAGLWCPNLRAQASTAAVSATQAKAAPQPPYDRLELLGSVSASMYRPYLIEKMRARGIDFTPDPAFLQAVATRNNTPELRQAIVTLKPRAGVPESPDRHKAYLILAQLVGHRITPSGGERAKFQEALALAPTSAALHLAYAGELLLIPDYPGTEVEERRSLELWPGDAEAHVGLAAALSGQGRDAEAIPEAREALRIFPDHKGAVVELGMALTRDQQYQEAVPKLRDAISRMPTMTLLHKPLGLSLFNTGDIEGAINEYQLYLQEFPNDAEAHYGLGAAFRSQGHKDDAQAQFREAARLEPSNPLFSSVADPSLAAKGPPRADGEQPDDGSIEGNTYTNRFFQFSIRFPENWTVMGSEAQREIAKLGGEIVAGGDQTLRDAAQAGAAHAYELLFVTAGKSGDQNYSTRSIQISALDSAVSPEITSGEAFLKSSARLLQKLHGPLQATGLPVEMSVGGRKLWRMDVTTQINDSINRGSEIVTIEKGYLLLFVLSSPDQEGLEEVLQIINSLRFSQTSN
jgi:Flp pilus assembly protein TadD